MSSGRGWLAAFVLLAWSCSQESSSRSPAPDASSGGTAATAGAGDAGPEVTSSGGSAGVDASDAAEACAGSVDPFLWADDLVEPAKLRPVGKAIWAGKAAWSNAAAVKAELVQRVAGGEVPYVFFYHWGDGPGTKMSEVQNATSAEIDQWKAFGKAIAEGIGTGVAFVVLEPEWDVNPTAANSPKFKDALKSIIQTFRTIAPNAELINGPGLWKSDSVYTDFADVASLMDLQGFLLHVVSNDPFCTKRADGTFFGGGKDLAGALGIVDEIRARAARVQKLFGTKAYILTDLAVTRCKWNDDGQKQIFGKLTAELTALYDEGLRGVSIRTAGPSDPSARYLGVENEGRFDWAGKPAEPVIQAVPGVMQSHLLALGCP